jgi:hypothetical protein
MGTRDLPPALAGGRRSGAPGPTLPSRAPVAAEPVHLPGVIVAAPDPGQGHAQKPERPGFHSHTEAAPSVAEACAGGVGGGDDVCDTGAAAYGRLYTAIHGPGAYRAAVQSAEKRLSTATASTAINAAGRSALWTEPHDDADAGHSPQRGDYMLTLSPGFGGAAERPESGVPSP